MEEDGTLQHEVEDEEDQHFYFLTPDFSSTSVIFGMSLNDLNQSAQCSKRSPYNILISLVVETQFHLKTMPSIFARKIIA